MGLLSMAVSYRAGKKKGRRLAERASIDIDDSAFDTCDHCGYMRIQHDDRGRCPRYE